MGADFQQRHLSGRNAHHLRRAIDWPSRSIMCGLRIIGTTHHRHADVWDPNG
jgi:hypothetical protein